MYSIETTYKDAQGNEKTIVVYDDVALDQRLKVVSPVLELEDNSAGSLSFTVYPTNQAYGVLEDSSTDPLAMLTATIRVYMVPPIVDPTGTTPAFSYSKEEIWEGRPLTVDKDFYNGKAVYCEGALCYLNDIDQPAVEYTADKIQNECTFSNKKSIRGGNLEFIDFFKAVLIKYNERAAYNRKFDIDGTYVNPIRIPLNYSFKGCLTDLAAIKAVQNPEARDIYQTMTGLSGYTSRGYVATYEELSNISSPAENDLCYVTANEAYYVYSSSAWLKTNVMDYVGEYYVYGTDPKSTSIPAAMIWTDVTSQIHLSCGISRVTGGENTKQTVSSIVENFGGHLKVMTVDSKRCLYYTAKTYPEDEFIGKSLSKAAQSVEFGKNLVELTKKRDGSEFFTVLLPIGAEISNDHPETIESMCENVIEHGDLMVTSRCTDLVLDGTIQPYDATQQLAYTSIGRDVAPHQSPRRTLAKIGLEPGYTYYLFTASYNQDTGDGTDVIQKNNYMYFLYDAGPNRPVRSGDAGGVSHPYYVGTLTTGESYPLTDEHGEVKAIYKNDRLLSMKQLPVSEIVTELAGEKFEIPEKGVGAGYALYFSCASLYARTVDDQGNNAELPSAGQIGAGFWNTHTLVYPKLYRTPYPNKDASSLNVREVDPHNIWWAGCTKFGGAERSDIDPHKLYPNTVSDKYGTNDYDMYIDQGTYVRVLGYTNSGRSSWHKMWDPWQTGGSSWKEANNPNWVFPTGYTGHHVARVLVEPGKTYYLNTRVTNPGFPKSSPDGTVDHESQQESGSYLPPDAPDHSIYFVRDTQSYAGKQNGSYSYPWGYGANKDYTHGDDAGQMKNREYYDVIAYAIVVRRKVYESEDTSTGVITSSWKWQILDKKLANRSQCATVFNMEEIKIPDAIPPEITDKPGEVFSFYDSEGNVTVSSGDEVCHLELWFACDECYLNGNGEYSNGELVGYVPEVFVEDATAVGNEGGVNYKNHVTVKPLQPAHSGAYSNWPGEYIINEDLYEKYGPIVKVSQYDTAYTPSQLMDRAKVEIDNMKGEESFEVSAIDLMACGIEDCDRLRLMQKIKINDDPHGVNASIVLTKMSIDLMDLTKNSYTLGYEANRGISSM